MNHGALPTRSPYGAFDVLLDTKLFILETFFAV